MNLIEIDFEVIADGHNADLVAYLEDANGVFWTAVPRVGDLISFREVGLTAIVKTVFWDYLTGHVLVKVR